MTISQKYLEFISLVQALNTIVFGDDTAEVTLDGITKPSISKFLAQVDALTTAELQRLRDAINVVMNQQSVPTTIVTDGTHSQEWINSDFRAALQALNDTKGLPNGYASLDANGAIPKEQLPNKIATTAIAQAGTNDTDFLTPKKLRDALNATGGAPISACRAWADISGGTSPSIRAESNILSVVRSGAGNYTVTFRTPMSSSSYIVFFGGNRSGSSGLAGTIQSRTSSSFVLRTWSPTDSSDWSDIFIGVFG